MTYRLRPGWLTPAIEEAACAIGAGLAITLPFFLC